jgi:FAD/FMN-containing dehydrogenase
MTTTTHPVGGRAGGNVTLAPEQLEELEARLDGRLLRDGDEGWEDAVLVWNGMVAAVPAVVVRPTGAEDVAAAVGFAREHG